MNEAVGAFQTASVRVLTDARGNLETLQKTQVLLNEKIAELPVKIWSSRLRR